MALQNGELEACKQSHKVPEDLKDIMDPLWVKMWDEHGAGKLRADEVPVEVYRKSPADYTFSYAAWSGPEVHKTEDIQIPVTHPEGQVTVRVYTPEGKGPWPVHFNMHGGGWVIGGLQSEAGFCASVCKNVGMKVIDIDYRLSPEVVYPVAIYDCWDVIRYVRDHAEQFDIDPTSISFGGLSAGGHMTAVLSHMARDEDIPIKLALMVVPSLDIRWSIAEEPLASQVKAKYPSVSRMSHNPWGPEARMTWFAKYWLPEDSVQPGFRKKVTNDWRLSPILQTNFKGLPRTHIVTAGGDLTVDETNEYAEIMKKNGNVVTAKCYAGMPHAFGHYNHPDRGLKQAHEYIKDCCEVISQSHGL